MPMYPITPQPDRVIHIQTKESEQTPYFENGILYHNNKSELLLYTPNGPAKGCVLIVPGGAYYKLAIQHEGATAAAWLNQHGWAAAVLLHRMPEGHPNRPLEDATKAIQWLREHTKDYNFPNKIGIMGFSAGGHLAATLLTKATSATLCPDFGILFYPVISLRDEITHVETRNNLLGSCSNEYEWSAEHYVTRETPPCLLLACTDDELVPYHNAQLFSQALTEAHVSSELHLYPQGGHGFGFPTQHPDIRQVSPYWPDIEQTIQHFLLSSIWST